MDRFKGVRFWINNSNILLSKEVYFVLCKHAKYFQEHYDNKLIRDLEQQSDGIVNLYFTRGFLTFQILDIFIGSRLWNIWEIDIVNLLYAALGLFVEIEYLWYIIRQGVRCFGNPPIGQVRTGVYFCWYNAISNDDQYKELGEFLLCSIGKYGYPVSLTTCRNYREFRRRFHDLLRHDQRLDFVQDRRPLEYARIMRRPHSYSRYNVALAVESLRQEIRFPGGFSIRDVDVNEFHNYCPICAFY